MDPLMMLLHSYSSKITVVVIDLIGDLSEKNTAIDHFGQLLEKAGYNYYGNETMYSGVDGRVMEVCPISIYFFD